MSDGKASAALAPFTISVPAAPNRAPTISGAPTTHGDCGPGVRVPADRADADGNTLGFSVQNRPTWATFSTSTGQFSGTPTAASAGTYSNIVISVSDGKASAALATFTITVNAAAERAP